MHKTASLLWALILCMPAPVAADYIDIQWSAGVKASDREASLFQQAMRRHFQRELSRLHPAAARLEILIHDFQRVSRQEPWQPPGFGSVRFIREDQSASMTLDYRIYDPQQSQWFEGTETVVQQSRPSAAARATSGDPYAHERYMVTRWMQQLSDSMQQQ
ncbi:MAG: DUF3016 domain-containing protein [Gammaproteobacteria bacterium]